MGYYYSIYDAEHNFKEIDSGKFSGMPFYYDNFPINFNMVCGEFDGYLKKDYSDPYNCTVLLGREQAEEAQKYMTENKTIFTDWMDENHTNTLVVRIT